jgi:tRNA(Arg) A34 adenosine deaminase TadA
MGTIEGKITQRDIELLYRAAEIATQARAGGNHPFGALLADKEGKILLEQGNEVVTDHNDCAHAETALLIRASKAYSREFLSECTLYTTIEPCVMCSGALYWSNVHRLVYALTEETLLELTGSNPENPTFSLPSRTVINHGQKDIVVVGPVEDEMLQERIIKDHRGFWEN